MPIFIHPQPTESDSNHFLVLSDNWKESADEPSMLVGRIVYYPDYDYMEFHPDVPWCNEGLHPREALSCNMSELQVYLDMKSGREVRSAYSRKLYELMALIFQHRSK